MASSSTLAGLASFPVLTGTFAWTLFAHAFDWFVHVMPIRKPKDRGTAVSASSSVRNATSPVRRFIVQRFVAHIAMVAIMLLQWLRKWIGCTPRSIPYKNWQATDERGMSAN